MNSNNRAEFFRCASSASPAMAMNMVGMGARYPATVRDASGEILSGGQNHKLYLPAGIPAKIYWPVTAYDAEHAPGLNNGQPLPSLNSMDQPALNEDGSVDIYFGPEKPEGAENWLAAVPALSKYPSFLAPYRLLSIEFILKITWHNAGVP